MPFTASTSPSGETSKLRNRQSKFIAAQAFSIAHFVGLPPTGEAKSARIGCTAGLLTVGLLRQIELEWLFGRCSNLFLGSGNLDLYLIALDHDFRHLLE